MASEKEIQMRQSGLAFLSERKGILVTPELCTACKGCQSACKQWNKLPAVATKNTGSMENPPDLSADTFNRIRFMEAKGADYPDWLFVSQRCMHCADAGCLKICPSSAIKRKDTGAIVVDQKKCIGCKLCRSACPFDIPRHDFETGKMSKCTLCHDRLANSLEPLCAKTCPTGALRFGFRTALIEEAKKGEYKIYGESDLDGTSVIYAMKKAPEYYAMESNPGIPATVSIWKSVLKPLTILGLGASIAAAAGHYLAYGPHEDEDGGKN